MKHSYAVLENFCFEIHIKKGLLRYNYSLFLEKIHPKCQDMTNKI